ncbi:MULTISPECIES: helix-turn-helix domain-containing protein [unclassified Enterococcus]|uniref:helix-turn-helix domain-containing protein n=1 Tax=unclassified Enterococcus TaxID=2608891 RepID=UPI001A9BE93C|nr:helix-turn-helix domain-containing protein [Enterococcus sp. DIV1271a]MBO1298406.1 helix-turn-helix domain-containing protein [Enterococcus sp. DIV1271a]
MIEKILLDDHARTKLSVYGKLMTLSPGEYSMDDVRENLDFHFSAVRFKKILFAIQEDLEQFTEIKLLHSKNKLSINEQLVQYTQYQHYLSTESVPYKLLISLLTEQDKDLADFCNRHFISRSTCFRQTKKLAEYLKEYQINLNLSNLTLSGSEMLIRIIFFNFFWFVSLGESLEILPFSQEVTALIYKHEEDYHKNKFDLGKKQASLHCLICLTRIKNNHSTDIYKLTRDSFIPSGTNIDFFYDFFKFANVRLDILEVNSLFYLFYYWPFLTSNQDIRMSIIQHSYHQPNNEVKDLLEEFQNHCQTFIGTFHFEKEPALYLNLYLSIGNFSLFRQKIPLTTLFISSYIQDKYPLLRILTIKIEGFWKKIAQRKNYTWLKACIGELAFIQACLLYPYYSEIDENYKLNVGFINVSEHLISAEILNLGKKIPFVDIKQLTLPITEEYDFFIFGSPLLIPKGLDPSKYTVLDFCHYSDFETELYQRLLEVHHLKLQTLFSD